MQILDKHGKPVKNPDPKKGKLKEAVKTVHHPAVKGVKEESHYETVKEYPNGGKEVVKVVTKPGVQAKEAWTEEVPYLLYEPYTPEELKEMETAKKPTVEERLEEIENHLSAIMAYLETLNIPEV